MTDRFCRLKYLKIHASALNEEETLDQNRDRQVGGGRKPELEKHLDIDEVFLDILKEHTAGDPMDEKVKWTDLTRRKIVVLLSKEGFKVSRNIVRKLLKKHGYVSLQALKKKAAKTTENRNDKEENIAKLRASYEKEGNPINRCDTKKKEKIGNIFRDGKIYTTETIEVFDHDFPSLLGVR